jgi:hypothetical protein
MFSSGLGTGAGRRDAGAPVARWGLRRRLRRCRCSGTLWGVFERFTQHARDVVVVAQAEARSLGQRQIGTEHLLLAILAADSPILVAVRRREEINRGARI